MCIRDSFTSVLYSAQQDAFYTEPPYTNIDVIDRIGAGDAYVAGVLFGLLKYGDPQKAMQFGNATSSVKNTVPGDLPSSDFKLELHDPLPILIMYFNYMIFVIRSFM